MIKLSEKGKEKRGKEGEEEIEEGSKERKKEEVRGKQRNYVGWKVVSEERVRGEKVVRGRVEGKISD